MLLGKLFEDMTTLHIIASIVDLLIVWFVVYKLITVIKGTKAVQLIKGIFFILIGRALSDFFDLTTTTQLFDMVLQWGFLAIIVIFQPELRRALEQLGRGGFFRKATHTAQQEFEKHRSDMIKAVQYMAKRRIGALIVFERETGLKDYIETGILINAEISSELLINIFIPNTPLHDGAMIIQGDKIATAASYLPLSESNRIAKDLGTRHRAAVGISEVTDAFTIVISEETGNVSVTTDSMLTKDITLEELDELLQRNWISTTSHKEGGGIFARK
ncbi:diadenylate cyclase CdaA [Phocicoccus pinnipedialis]|uniref:Diadenylate cyclase n=1 Tax=Phocicoccus pinnipedialis TaxID=110845 RepID=A0A6V7R090_9BACL|nr:diadenylate cyclase CdaA [Jeotgalicoccus pinnipedialis]MBP1938703.1 diadenylate cyclase [Jeotgalicoccus pinnipedialis]CAD2070478.1 DNA integrity scanning protein DisA [Jeotgalicoccus pinnipedialis]